MPDAAASITPPVGIAPGTDAALVAAAQLGDNEAFSAIVKRYGKRVYRAAYFLVKNLDDAADITQETFVRAYRNIRRFDLARPIFPWLHRIARNLSLNSLQRADHRTAVLPEEDIVAGNLDEPDADLLRNETTGELYRAIDRLSKEHREIIMLKHFEDCSYADMAEILNIPIGSVMSRLYNARTRLRDILSRQERKP